MKSIKNLIAAITLASFLSISTFAADGILVGGRDGILVGGKSGRPTKSNACTSGGKINAGILVGGFTGILVGGFTGILVGGFTGILVGGATGSTNTNCGILVGG